MLLTYRRISASPLMCAVPGPSRLGAAQPAGAHQDLFAFVMPRDRFFWT